LIAGSETGEWLKSLSAPFVYHLSRTTVADGYEPDIVTRTTKIELVRKATNQWEN